MNTWLGLGVLPRWSGPQLAVLQAVLDRVLCSWLRRRRTPVLGQRGQPKGCVRRLLRCKTAPGADRRGGPRRHAPARASPLASRTPHLKTRASAVASPPATRYLDDGAYLAVKAVVELVRSG